MGRLVHAGDGLWNDWSLGLRDDGSGSYGGQNAADPNGDSAGYK